MAPGRPSRLRWQVPGQSLPPPLIWDEAGCRWKGEYEALSWPFHNSLALVVDLKQSAPGYPAGAGRWQRGNGPVPPIDELIVCWSTKGTDSPYPAFLTLHWGSGGIRPMGKAVICPFHISYGKPGVKFKKPTVSWQVMVEGPTAEWRRKTPLSLQGAGPGARQRTSCPTQMHRKHGTPTPGEQGLPLALVSRLKPDWPTCPGGLYLWDSRDRGQVPAPPLAVLEGFLGSQSALGLRKRLSGLQQPPPGYANTGHLPVWEQGPHPSLASLGGTRTPTCQNWTSNPGPRLLPPSHVPCRTCGAAWSGSCPEGRGADHKQCDPCGM